MLIAAAAFALTVRVYDVYGLSPADRQVMLSVASTALADAGVDAAFVDCSGPRPAAACQLSVAPTELILRIHRLPPDGSHALGIAFIHGQSETDTAAPNTVATIFATHVAEMARRSGTSLTTLMGHVAAHELGHLLLGWNHHEPEGLMRASWTWLMIQRSHPEDWRFSAADIATIRLRLERRQTELADALVETARIATAVMSSGESPDEIAESARNHPGMPGIPGWLELLP